MTIAGLRLQSEQQCFLCEMVVISLKGGWICSAVAECRQEIMEMAGLFVTSKITAHIDNEMSLAALPVVKVLEPLQNVTKVPKTQNQA